MNVRAVQADGSVSCEASETLVSVFRPSGGAPDGAERARLSGCVLRSPRSLAPIGNEQAPGSNLESGIRQARVVLWGSIGLCWGQWMQEYRAYIMGPDVQNRVDIHCDDEAEAIRLAKLLVDTHDVELWQLDRKIATFTAAPLR